MTYTDVNRGAIQFRQRRKQLIDFSGLRFGNITPTDCDALIEYHGKAFFFIEFKLRNADVPFGQMLALKRLVDALERAGKYAVLIIAEHTVDNPVDDIDAATCTVRKYYNYRSEHEPTDISVKTLIEKIIARIDG